MQQQLTGSTTNHHRTGTIIPLGQRYLEATRFGNALQVGAEGVEHRWHLDYEVGWARVKVLLSAEQQQAEADARTDLAFLTNAALGAVVVFLASSTGLLAPGVEIGIGTVFGILGGALFAVVCYRLSADAASKLVRDVQGSLMDVTWRQLYDRLGVTQPTSVEELRHSASSVNQFLRYGVELSGGPSLRPTRARVHPTADATP